MGTVAAILIGVARGQLSWTKLWLAIKDTLLITAMIMMIIAGCARIWALHGGDGHTWCGIRLLCGASPTGVGGHDPDHCSCTWWPGCFMDSLAMVTLTVPILLRRP